MTRLAEHTFVRETYAMDLTACPGCGFPARFCDCDPEDDDLPAYRGCDPKLYEKEQH